MDFETLIQRPGIQSVLLAEVVAAVPVQAWVPYNDIWRAAVSEGILLATLDADGVTVTAGANVAAVEATPGRWVQSSGYVYYNPAMGEPYAEVVIGRARFYFSDLPKAFDHPYESRIKSVPRLSLRIEPTFGGVAQVGGGKLSLHNEDGFFDSLPVRWDNGSVVLRLGLDLRDAEMDYEDYQVVGTWALDGAMRNDASFDLDLKERKNNLRTKIPTAKFSRDDWPNLEDGLIGKPVPTIYGRVYGVTPYLVDPNTYRLKVCSHAVRGFIGLRKQESRDRTDSLVPTWFIVPGTVYYRTAFNHDIIRVICDGTDLVEVPSVDAVAATVSSYHERDNFLYLRPPAGVVPTVLNTVVEVAVSYDAWTNIPFETRDEANGEFTVAATDWDGEAELVVDVIGYAMAGEALQNPADIIEQILASAGETNLNTDSFDEARAYFDLGTTARHGERIIHLKPSLCLDREQEALRVLEQVNSMCGTYLYVNASGQWYLGVAQPESVAVLDLSEIELFQMSAEQRTDQIFTSVEVRYRIQDIENRYLILTESSDRLLGFSGKEVHQLKQVEAALWDERDARYLAQRILSTQGQPLQLFKAVVPRMGLTLQPGNKVRVRRQRGDRDELMEVIDVDYDLISKQSSLLLGDMRGWGRTCGFWTGDGQADWNPAWTNVEARDALAESGFWTDANGYPDAADARGRAGSRYW